MADWPLCYRVITVPANPEVSRYQERHGAIIQRRQVMQWLDAQVSEIDLLVTPAAGAFVVEEIAANARHPIQRTLAL
jgi:putative SOS response-associated peptidase YedK